MVAVLLLAGCILLARKPAWGAVLLVLGGIRRLLG